MRRLREAKGLTQLYVATFVGVTTDTISRWENRRYPSIKEENALKLAEALEVELEEILDTEGPDLQEPSIVTAGSAEEERPESHDEPPETEVGRQPVWRRRLWPILLIVVLIPFLWYHFSFKQQPAITVHADRILPPHAPAGEIFPVLIHVGEEGMDSFSLIIKESLPTGCLPVKSAPPFTTIDVKNSLIKWINRSGEKNTPIAYLLRMPPAAKSGEPIRFTGNITVRNHGGSAATISGSSSLTCSNFHWADTNQDGRIDDDEILAAYDTFGALDALGFDWAEIDNIWSAQGYHWDAKKKKYIIIH